MQLLCLVVTQAIFLALVGSLAGLAAVVLIQRYFNTPRAPMHTSQSREPALHAHHVLGPLVQAALRFHGSGLGEFAAPARRTEPPRPFGGPVGWDGSCTTPVRRAEACPTTATPAANGGHRVRGEGVRGRCVRVSRAALPVPR